MEKLEDFALVESIFRGIGITPNWLHALAFGLTKIYNDGCLLNYYCVDGICVINSAGDKFNKSILRDIKTLIDEYDSVVISSSQMSIEKYMAKYGFSYDSKSKVYKRGI